MSTAARGGRSSGRATAVGDTTRGPAAAAAAAAPPPPPAPLSSTLLPQQLVNLSTLVLVSRAAAETSTGATASNSVTHARQQPLDALSHLLTSYLSLAATQATHAANLAGRSRIAPWDVVTALGDIGYAGKRGLDELLHEAGKGDEGVEPEAEQLRQLATALQDRLASPPIQPPICQMSYDPLNPSELDLLTYFNSLPAEGASTPGTATAAGDDDGGSSSSAGSEDSDRQEEADDAIRTPPPPHEMTLMHIKAEPNSSLDVGGLDNLGDLDMANLTGGIESDAAFLDSLGLGTSSSTAPSGASGGGGGVVSAPGGGGIGDVTASVFHPLDLAGRPIADLSILGPAHLDSLASSFPVGFGGLMNLDLGSGGGHGQEEEEEEEDARPFPAWSNEADIPSYVPPFFPPFPGMERESAEALARRRRRARERERDALAAATAASEYQQRLHNNNNNRRGGAAGGMIGGGAGDPWAEVIPYSTSSLATMAAEFGHSLPTPSSPRSAATKRLLEAQRVADKENGDGGSGGGGGNKRTKRRRRSLSPPPTATTSLTSFANIQPLIPHEPTFLPPNQERRSAAGYIAFASRHPELNVSSDSLFGSLPYAAPLRQATLPPGFLPDFAPPLIHPFNTNLPYTVSNPVPYHPAAPTSILPAPPPNPRLPTPLSSIARELTFPFRFDNRPGMRDQLHPNIALFARLRRIGPPGPLGPKGEALNYEYIGNTALLALSAVDWPERRHNAKLPRRFGDDAEGGGGGGSGGGAGGSGGGGAGGEGGSGTGIKLKLGGNNSSSSAANMQGRQTREGSLFGGGAQQQISTPWNTFGASPSVVSTPFTTAGGDIDLAAFSASLASAPTTIDAFAPLNGTAVANSSGAGLGLPQADFDYPDFLLSAGGLSATDGGGDAGQQTGAFDWATVPTSTPTPTPAQPSSDAVPATNAAAGTANGT